MAGTETFQAGHVLEGDLPAPDVSVVVTLLNESGSVEELYRRTVAALDPGLRTFELIFVDDGSTDGTFAVLERLHAGDPRRSCRSTCVANHASASSATGRHRPAALRPRSALGRPPRG